MQSTLKPNGQQIIPGTEEYAPEPEPKKRKLHSGNRLMRALTPNMWSEPYMIDDVEPIMSDDFCLDKGDKLLLTALAFETEEEWLDYCRKVYVWKEDTARRELDSVAEKQAAQYKENPLLLELILEKIKAESEPEARNKKNAVLAK